MTKRSDPILEVVDVCRTFVVRRGLFSSRRQLHALNGVSLSIYKGEVMGLVGESACGKSTLAKLMLGLLPTTSGEILLNDKPVAEWERSALARKIQIIFQDPYSSLNPRRTVDSIISLPLRIHKVGNPSSWRSKVEEMLDLVGLPRRLYNSYPSQLSSGQRQRVAIGRALIMRPEIVICDEPTSALDVSVQSQILNLLIDLWKALGVTYLLISHNLAVVEHLATRVAVMYLGRIVEEAQTVRLFSNPRHPYTRLLLESVLTPDPDLGIPDTHLGASFPNPFDLPLGCSFHPRCPYARPVCMKSSPPPHIDADGYTECFLNNSIMR